MSPITLAVPLLYIVQIIDLSWSFSCCWSRGGWTWCQRGQKMLLINPSMFEFLQPFQTFSVFLCVQTESSDEDEASGDEGLPDDDSDVSSRSPNRPQDPLRFWKGAGDDRPSVFVRTGKRRKQWRTTMSQDAERTPKRMGRTTWSMKMRVKRNEGKSYIKLDLKELYMYFCFISMFLILLEWFYNLKAVQPGRPPLPTASPGRWHHYLPPEEKRPHIPQSGGRFCSVLQMTEKKEDIWTISLKGSVTDRTQVECAGGGEAWAVLHRLVQIKEPRLWLVPG